MRGGMLKKTEAQLLMEDWDFAKQHLIQKDFSDYSEEALIAMMLTAAIGLKELGYRRMDEQWVSLSEAN
jgi:hypothetical protein